MIDPDRIARDINPCDPRALARVADGNALALFEAALATRRSLSLGTTLADHFVLRRLQVAKAAGYEVAVDTAAHAVLSTLLLTHLAEEIAGSARAVRRMVVLRGRQRWRAAPVPGE